MEYRHPLYRLAREHARAMGDRLARAAMRDLKRYTEGLGSGEDSGLKNVWEEICVQVQGEESFFWDAYEEMALGHLRSRIERLRETSRKLLWVPSDDALEWLAEAEDPDADAKEFRDIPLPDIDQLARYVFVEHLRPLAMEFTNGRIRRFFEDGSEGDFSGSW